MSGSPSNGFQQACSACGRHGAKGGENTFTCKACLGASYCNKACQVQNWPLHKSFCKAQQKFHASRAAAGMDSATSFKVSQKILSWYSGPDNRIAALAVAAIAWIHRAESPYIRVVGGIDGKVEEIDVVPRRVWMKENAVVRDDLARRFSAPDFDMNTSFITALRPLHPGTEKFPEFMPRTMFPHITANESTSAKMDKNVALLKKLKGLTLGAGKRVVQLKGFPESESLNGRRGVRLAYDTDIEEWSVQLDLTRAPSSILRQVRTGNAEREIVELVSVKRENYELAKGISPRLRA